MTAARTKHAISPRSCAVLRFLRESGPSSLPTIQVAIGSPNDRARNSIQTLMHRKLVAKQSTLYGWKPAIYTLTDAGYGYELPEEA